MDCKKCPNPIPENGVPVLVPFKDEEKVIVCDVCGHKNPDNTAICEMCSNYLSD